jgi:hypothetical protein
MWICEGTAVFTLSREAAEKCNKRLFQEVKKKTG